MFRVGWLTLPLLPYSKRNCLSAAGGRLFFYSGRDSKSHSEFLYNRTRIYTGLADGKRPPAVGQGFLFQ